MSPADEPYETALYRLLREDQTRRPIDILVNYPWCWPPPGTELRKGLEKRGLRPPLLRPGEVCFVTIGDEARLWRVDSEHPDGDTAVLRFAGNYDASRWQRLRRQVDEVLASLSPDARSLEEPRVFARWLASEDTDDTPKEPVREHSCDLAVCFHYASLRLNKPPRADFIASAELLEDGTLDWVGGLEDKVSALPLLAPNVVCLVLGKPPNEPTRLRLLAELREKAPRVALKTCDTLGEALAWMLADEPVEQVAAAPAPPSPPAAGATAIVSTDARPRGHGLRTVAALAAGALLAVAVMGALRFGRAEGPTPAVATQAPTVSLPRHDTSTAPTSVQPPGPATAAAAPPSTASATANPPPRAPPPRPRQSANLPEL